MTNDITLTFGKHNGKKLSQVPTSYVEWLAELNKKGVSEHAQAFLNSHKDEMPRFEGYHNKTLGGWVSVEDQEEIWLQNRLLDQEYEEQEKKLAAQMAERLTHPDLEWVSPSYGTIKVWAESLDWNIPDDLTVEVKGKRVGGNLMPVPAGQRAQAKANGIVAVISTKLGNVGLTAERKAKLESLGIQQIA